MYSVKNGILYRKENPVFCVGLSYYPSYHERKVPVPENGDRVMVQVPESDGYYLAAVNNISGVEECRTNIELDLGNVSARKVVMYTPQQKNELKKKGNIVLIPQLKWGAFC